MRRIPFLTQVLKSEEFSTKIYIYFSSKVAGDDYDPYEKGYTFTNQNPKVIKGYVRDIAGEVSYYKQYGLHMSGMKEIICDSKYKDWFKNCNKIIINGDSYQTFKAGVGNKTAIIERPFNIIRVTVSNWIDMKNHKLNCICGICKTKRGEYIGKNNPVWKARESLICLNCKKEIWLVPWLAKKRKFCSNNCRMNFNKGINHPRFGTKNSILHREKIKKINSELWKKITFRNKMIPKVLNNLKFVSKNKPNNAEISLLLRLEGLFPDEYKYVGDYKFWIEKYNPDFINVNGQKKIIEMFGDYWHNLPNYKERDIKRLKTYSKYGYNTLVIWEHELNNDRDILDRKLMKFHNLDCNLKIEEK